MPATDAPLRLAPATRAAITLALLLLSIASIVLAPTAVPASYAWVSDSISEAAGQRVAGAWLARFGFVSFGFAVLLLSGLAGARWGRWGTLLHGAFGICMVLAAAFSSRSWDPAVPFDEVEDFLHSVAASLLGAAFAIGVVAVSARRARHAGAVRLLDLVAVVASVVIPVAMFSATSLEDVAGMLQRVMFAIAYIWYAHETVRSVARDQDH